MVGVQYDREYNAVVFTANGSLKLKDIVQAIYIWAQDPAYHHDINMAWDLSECTWQEAASEFFLITKEVVERVNREWAGQRIALVVATETEVALIDTHLALSGWTATWRGFSQKDPALQWLLNNGDRTLYEQRRRDVSDF